MAEMNIDITNVIERAIEKIRQEGYTVQKWISCAEQLPERETDVLVYIPVWEDNPIQVAYLMYDGITWELSDGEFNFGKREVLHWMHLPEIPEPPEKE